MATFEELLEAAGRAHRVGDATNARILVREAVRLSSLEGGQPVGAGQVQMDATNGAPVYAAPPRAEGPVPASATLQQREAVARTLGSMGQQAAPTPEQRSAIEGTLATMGGTDGGGDELRMDLLRRQLMARQAQARARLEQREAGPAQPGMSEDDLALDLAIATARAQQQAQRRPGTVGGMAGAASDGALFGFGDEYLAGLSAVFGVQPDGQGGADWFQYGRPIGERYGVALDAIRQEQGQFREDNPGAALGAEVAGSLLAPGAGLAGRAISGAATTGGRIARAAAVGGAGGAAYGFGEGEGGVVERAAGALPAAAVGAVAGGTLAAVGQGFNRAARALSRDPALRAGAPTLEAMRDTANRLYQEAEALGGTMPEGTVRFTVARMQRAMQSEGFDRQLHPRLATVLDRFTSEKGPKSLSELAILRRVATNAAQSAQPDERRLASILIDELDEAVSRIGGGSGALAEARAVWARMRRLETVERAIEQAALSDNFGQSLRTQFRALLRSPKKLRGFTSAEVGAIRGVAKGTVTAQALRGLGRVLSPTEMSGAALTGGAVYATASGAGLGPLALPVVGYGARRIADAMTSGAAQRARDAVAGFQPAQMRNALSAAPYAPGVAGETVTDELGIRFQTPGGR